MGKKKEAAASQISLDCVEDNVGVSLRGREREREIEREGERERERRLRNSSCPVKVVLHQKRGKKMEFKLGNFCSNNHLLLSNSDTKPTALWPSRTAVRVPTC